MSCCHHNILKEWFCKQPNVIDTLSVVIDMRTTMIKFSYRKTQKRMQSWSNVREKERKIKSDCKIHNLDQERYRRCRCTEVFHVSSCSLFSRINILSRIIKCSEMRYVKLDQKLKTLLKLSHLIWQDIDWISTTSRNNLRDCYWCHIVEDATEVFIIKHTTSISFEWDWVWKECGWEKLFEYQTLESKFHSKVSLS